MAMARKLGGSAQAIPGTRIIGRLLDTLAEARLRRIQYEIAVYGGRFRVSSKNDDDLPRPEEAVRRRDRPA